PKVKNRSPNRILGQVPRDHDESGDQGHRYKARARQRAFRSAQYQSRQRPGDVSHSNIGKAKEDGHLRELGPHKLGEMVVSVWKPCTDAYVLKDVPDNQAEHHKSQDAAPAVDPGAVNESKDGCGNYVDRGNRDDGNAIGEELSEPGSAI